MAMSWYKRDYSTTGIKQRDYGLRVTSDNSGSYYVSGVTAGKFALLKYSNAGTLLWSREHSGSLDFNSQQDGNIDLDASGNIYCLFSSCNIESGWDWILQKYDTSGYLIWTKTYDAGTFDTELARCIEIDNVGNIIIAGNFNFISSEMRIIKISPLGNTIWTFALPNSNTYYNLLTDITLDLSGNIYYTGMTTNFLSNSYDLTAGKVDVNGSLAWRYDYNGVLNAYDQGNGISLDPSGNVILTGIGAISMAAIFDAIVIRLSSTGTFDWLYNFNHTSNGNETGDDIECDVNGNIYVGGYAYDVSGFENYLTLKVAPTGSLLWSRLYPTTPGGNDYIRKLIIDANSNVIVTGTCYNGPSGKDALTIKYDPLGTLVWVNAYNSNSNNLDEGKYIAIDYQGRIIVTGIAFDATTLEEIFITVINPANGQTIWSRLYGTPGNLDEEDLTLLVTDKYDFVYVAGTKFTSSGTTDVLISKYDPAGNKIWTQTYAGPGGFNDIPYDIAIDTLCNLYLVGQTYISPQSGINMLILKYDLNGTLVWNVDYGQNLTDIANTIVVNDSGHVYVGGFITSSSFGADYTILKLKPNGTTRWVRTLLPTFVSNSYDQVKDLSFADTGRSIVATGSMMFTSTGRDIYTVKLDTAGNTVWSAAFNNFGGLHDIGQFIRVDSNQNVLVGGAVGGSSGYADHCILQYSASGSLNWNNVSGTNMDDSIRAMVLDPFNNVILTGYTEQPTTSRDVSTKKINPSGTLVWNAIFSSPSPNPDDGYGIVVDSVGKIYVVAEIEDTLHGGIRIHILSYNINGQLTDSLLFHEASTAKPRTMTMMGDESGFYWCGWGNYQINQDGLLVKYCISPTIVSLPSFVNAPNTVCNGTPNVLYSVPFISNVLYNWSYSGSGVTLIQNGDSALLSFSPQATSGTLSVYCSNSNCTQSNVLAIYINASPCLSVSNFDDQYSNFLLYPNPALNEFIIRTDDSFLLDIMDINGKIFSSKKLQQGNNIISSEELNSGYYIARLTNSKMILYRRFIILD